MGGFILGTHCPEDPGTLAMVKAAGLPLTVLVSSWTLKQAGAWGWWPRAHGRWVLVVVCSKLWLLISGSCACLKVLFFPVLLSMWVPCCGEPAARLGASAQREPGSWGLCQATPGLLAFY